MKKFVLKSVAAAAGLACFGSVLAGSITAPAAPVKYAVEALAAGATASDPSPTDITLPTISYRVGVARTTAQDFTMIITPSGGAKFLASSCLDAVPTGARVRQVAGTAATGAAVVSLKRSGGGECAYEVDITGGFDLSAAQGTIELDFVGLKLDTHGLNVAGTTASVEVGLKDLGESAFIDNPGNLKVDVATSGRALSMTATADSDTKADVNHPSGPLFGFVAGSGDVADVADASFTIVNNNNGASRFRTPDNSRDWDFNNVADGTKITVTVAGNFQGLKAGGFTVTGGGAPTATINTTGDKATFEISRANVVSNVAPANGVTTITTKFETAKTASLGVSRTFGVSAVGDVVGGDDFTLSGGATSWWSWGANASQLIATYFTTNSTFLSRFFLLNSGTAPVGYSATCSSEDTRAITYGTKRTGTLSAGTDGVGALTTINAADVCTFTGATRGSVVFTINAPIESVKGTYQYIDPNTLNGVVVPLVRPYSKQQTTE